MLLRVYRLTDKFGLIFLKTSVLFGDLLLNAARSITGVFSRVVGVVLAIVLVVIRLIGRVILWVIRGIRGLLVSFTHAGTTVTRQVARSGSKVRSESMARRAAREEMRVALAEDPLKTQNRALSSLTVVLLLLLLGVVLWATNPTRTTPGLSAASGAVNFAPSTLIPSPAAALATPVPTNTALPSILAVRGSLAYVVREKGQDDIWAVEVGARTPIRLTNDAADDRDPAWSPDGRQLAFASRRDGNWEIYIYDINSGETTRMTYELSFQGAPHWSPDGKWLVYESYQTGNLDIFYLPVDNSQPPQALTSNPAADFSPSWSPDGRRIAFVSWRDGNQDIFVFSLDDPRDEASINLTQTAQRDEDFPEWSPDGDLLAYSAVDEGIEKVFVKQASDPTASAQVLERGRAPAWAPDGLSLVYAVDSLENTQLVAGPFAGTGVATSIIPVPLGSDHPSWTATPLPSALVNSGGLNAPLPAPLFVEDVLPPQQEDPPYKLHPLNGVEAQSAYLSDRVNDSFEALREASLEHAGWDFLGQLEDAFWPIDRLPQPGEERRNWHMTGRAFAINRNAIVGFPAPMEVVREDRGVNTYWRIYVRVTEDAQDGQLGEPLRIMPWDFLSANQGDVEAYDAGGRLRTEMPTGYYIDLTRLAHDYGWQWASAGSDWRGNVNSRNYWLFTKADGLNWYSAMRELYTEGQMGGFAPQATAAPAGAGA